MTSEREHVVSSQGGDRANLLIEDFALVGHWALESVLQWPPQWTLYPGWLGPEECTMKELATLVVLLMHTINNTHL